MEGPPPCDRQWALPKTLHRDGHGKGNSVLKIEKPVAASLSKQRIPKPSHQHRYYTPQGICLLVCMDLGCVGAWKLSVRHQVSYE